MIGEHNMDVSVSTSGARSLSNYISAYDKEIKSSLERLSSGLRVTQPSDDTGAYFKAEALKRRSSISTNVARDLENHISRLKTADEQLTTVKGLLSEMSALALEASGESTASIRQSLGEEYDAKVTALSDIITKASYDGDDLLDGDLDSGAGGTAKTATIDEDPSTDTYTYDILDTVFTSSTGLNLSSYSSAATDWNSSAANATSYYDALENSDSGLVRLERNSNRISTHLTILEGARDALNNKAANYDAAVSALVEVDEAEEATLYSSLQIRQEAAASFLAQFNISRGNVLGSLTGS